MKSASFRRFIGRLLPIAVAIAALLYAIHRTDLDKTWQHLRQASLGWLLLVSAGMTLLNCAADTFAMYHVFAGFGLRLRFFDLYTIRAATYTLAVIHYHAGQLGIIGFLYRVARVPLSRASAYILFIIGIWVALLVIFATGGALLGGPKGRAVLPWLTPFALGLVVYALVLRFPPRFLRVPPVAIAGSAKDSLLTNLWQRVIRLISNLWEPLHTAGLSGHLRALLVRLPHLAVLLIWHFIALRCFHIKVPFYLAMLYLPVVFAVGALPISIFGLGTTQMVAPYYFADFAGSGPSGNAAAFAYSLSMTAISTVSNLVMGFLFLRRGARLGLSTTPEQTAKMEAQLTAEAQAASAPPTISAEENSASLGSVLYPNSEDRLILH